MKIKQIEYPIDCYFEYDGQKIGVHVKHDDKPIHKVRGVEKISGFFEFVGSDGENLGAIAFYEKFEDMSPVQSSIAKAHYIELLKIIK